MQFIYGINPVRETLRTEKAAIDKILIAKGRKGRDIDEITTQAAHRGVSVSYHDRDYLTRIGGNASHQGIICICKEYEYVSVDDVIGHRHDSFRDSVVLILDSIEDPQNLGSIIRTAYSFGIDGLIIPEHRAASVTPAAIKVSAGAALHIPVARVVNIAQTLDYLKEKKFWIYGADASASDTLEALDFSGNVGLVMGSEGKGIRPRVKKKCDALVSIQMCGDFDSLNVSVATGIILYQISRQRRKY
jgi:23S rRNA (guanosine2251-2'-O)-methyltransferase